MATLSFENIAQADSGKQGVYKPDANGYFQVLLGGFGLDNSSGHYYTPDRIKDVFSQSSELMERVNNGMLYGEWGHPKMDPGMTNRDFLIKLIVLHEEQISHHIKKLELDDNYQLSNGKTCIACYGWVKPFGPKGEILQEALTNPDQNCCFSIRSLTMDKEVGGRITKDIVKIITWDAVLEPGIHIADKYHNPALESKRVNFTDTDIRGAYQRSVNHVGLESAGVMIGELAKLAGVVNLDAPLTQRTAKAIRSVVNRSTITRWKR